MARGSQRILVLVAASTLAPLAWSQAWRDMESPLLLDHVQLTFPERFHKAGEAYFDPTGAWIIFQAIPAVAEGADPDEHYSMYVAPLARDERGWVTGLGEEILLSPPGSANTCGWFHPTQPGVVLFGSTLVPPTGEDVPGYQRDKSRYQWAFPPEMDVVRTTVEFESGTFRPLERIFSREGYDAECSWSPDGRFLLYANVNAEKSEHGKADADLWIFDVSTGEHHLIVEAPGYDGGPFFSPDGRSICYRSDREGNDLLQIYISRLRFNDAGVPVGIESEHAITANDWVNWAPFFHPSGEFLIFTGSGPFHEYDVYAVELDAETGYAMSPEDRTIRRVTFTGGFDGLPVFSPDGSMMMWTSQRTSEGDGRTLSQLWLARVNPDASIADWTGPLSEAQAVAIAQLEIGEDPGRMMGVARLEGKDWIYEARILSGQNPGVVRVRVRPDGTGTILPADSGS